MMDRRQQRVLRQHLQTDALLGVEAVPRSQEPGAVEMLGEATPGNAGDAMAGRMKDETPGATAEATAGPQGAERQEIWTGKPMSRPNKIRALKEMDEKEVRGCKKCGLCTERTQTVFGEGDPEAEVMFIGEGPGQTEDEMGRPFVGRAGALLDKMIAAMGYAREQVYITNVVKCRPPNNRTPTPVEVQACWSHLGKQIAIIRPKVIVTLGGPAMKMVLDVSEGITRLRGIWHEYRGIEPAIAVMPTFHPAYLLRSYTKENRAKVWSDLQAVMTKIR
jgi:DNA polymerase